MGKLIDSIKAEPIEVKGERVVLKRAIPKGKFQLMHKDVDFKKKVRVMAQERGNSIYF